MKTILAIDPGKNLGFAVLRGRKRVTSGVLKFDSGPWRWAELERELVRLIDAYAPDVFAYERPNVSGLKSWDAIRSITGTIVIAELVAHERDVAFEPVAVTTIKKTATGSGAAKKPAMIAAACKRWRRKTVTADEADALWIAETFRLGDRP